MNEPETSRTVPSNKVVVDQTDIDIALEQAQSIEDDGFPTAAACIRACASAAQAVLGNTPETNAGWGGVEKLAEQRNAAYRALERILSMAVTVGYDAGHAGIEAVCREALDRPELKASEGLQVGAPECVVKDCGRPRAEGDPAMCADHRAFHNALNQQEHL